MPIETGSDLHQLVEPLIAFAVLAGLALVTRWAFGTGVPAMYWPTGTA